MNIRNMISVFSLTALTTVYGTNKEQIKKNVIFIFADDMTYNAINALGNKELFTPNLDKLIKEGTTFTQTFNMGAWNGAVSIASRAMLMTGRYLWNAKAMEDQQFKPMVDNKESFVQVMKENGYDTFMSGKWHISGVEPQSLFDETVHVRPGGMPSTVKIAYNRPLNENDTTWKSWDTINGGYWEGGKHWSEVMADDAIDYLRKKQNNKNPFFMYLAFNAPHDPRQAPKSFLDMYPIEKIKLPESYMPEFPLKNEIGASKSNRDERLAPFPRTEYAIKKHLQEYYAIISHLDCQVGKILDYLKKSGLDKNTMIIFTADNGLAIGKHGLMGKISLFDHSMRVPLIFSGPGIKKGKVCNELVYMQDLVPTIYDYNGIKIPEHVQFKSLISLIDGNSNHLREYIYGGYMKKQRMIRDDRYKLFLIPSAKKVFLFDLEKDPWELTNLYGNKKYDKTIKTLYLKLLEEQKTVGDDLDISSYFPELN